MAGSDENCVGEIRPINAPGIPTLSALYYKVLVSILYAVLCVCWYEFGC